MTADNQRPDPTSTMTDLYLDAESRLIVAEARIEELEAEIAKLEAELRGAA